MKRLRKVHDENDAKVEALNHEYLTHRNAMMEARAAIARREAGLHDGTLHEARKCEAIVGHYLILMRQRLLWIPNRVRARFKQTDLVDFISNEIDAALNELADLPEAVASGRVVSYARDPESVEGNGNWHELTMTRKVSKRDRARYPRD